MRHAYQFLLALLLLLPGGAALAQGTTTAAINGLVTDAAGQPVIGATVVAIHQPTNTFYAMPTNDQGRFSFRNVRVGGPYVVKFTLVGSADQQRGDIFLVLGQNLRLDVQMVDQAQQLGTTVVEGRRDAVVNADRTGAATQISREQIERLPTINRSFDDFTRLTPQANGQSFGGRNGGYNNVTIDGALFNNAFGLSSTVGGQANAQPISLDAVDQIQVSLAPYDVRQGSFTGAGINAVTRSGTNDVSASIYGFYRNQNFVGSKVGDVEQAYPDFKLKNYGFRFGAPIVKDKLFLFLNAEQERRDDPPAGNYTALRPGQTAGGNISSAQAADLDQLSAFLKTKYGYDAGAYENYQLKQNSDKATAKLDWNISPQHRLSVKYNYLNSYRDVAPSTSGSLPGGRGQGNTGLPFLSSYYRISNNLHSVIAELNSTFGAKASNNFTMGYSAFRDFREAKSSAFPLVDIGNGSGSFLTSFGYEGFSANNILNSDVFQIGDNYSLNLGRHVVTLGTYNEFYKFKNGFAPNYYGNYQFASLADFYSNANQTPNASGGISSPTLFQQQYAANPAGDFPFAVIKAAQYGLYVQDDFTVRPNLKVTLGLRADVPVIPTDIARNDAAAALTFRDGAKIETDKFQKASLLFSPRVGFNYDVKNDQATQLRGGTGIFTGRVPFVWISNQASNNGVLFGSVRNTAFAPGMNGVLPAGAVFSPDPTTTIPADRKASSSYNLAVTARDFKFPQVWRTNLAVDQKLPGGLIATLEGIYTKDLNAVYHQNANLPNPTQNLRAGNDTRPIFYTFGAPNAAGFLVPVTGNRINGNISDAIVMRNTSKGYSYSLTAQVRRSFSNGLYLDAAYTYSDARSVNDGGSIAQSIWRDRTVSGDPNAADLAYSTFLQQHRVIASGSYRKEYLNHLGTTISVFYAGAPATNNFGSSRVSYVYSNDLNGDGASSGGVNDLIYVPRNAEDIVLQDQAFRDNKGNVVATYTAAQQWTDLNAYIEQDKYLSDRRGQFAERNGAVNPWQHRIDLRLLQDVFTNLGNDKKNTLQFSLDIFNVGNLLNSDWGIVADRQPRRPAELPEALHPGRAPRGSLPLPREPRHQQGHRNGARVGRLHAGHGRAGGPAPDRELPQRRGQPQLALADADRSALHFQLTRPGASLKTNGFAFGSRFNARRPAPVGIFCLAV